MDNFQTPWFLFLLLILPLLFLYEQYQKRKTHASIYFPNLNYLKPLPTSLSIKFLYILILLRYLSLALIIIALARPQSSLSEDYVEQEGIDIILALDISGSMRAMDFQPNHRLYVAKDVLQEFIKKRKGDRIGLVIFAGESFTQCPITLDHKILSKFIEKVDFNLIKNQGTAIGSALINAGNRLENSKTKSKIVILLTDGENNQGEISPLVAAQALQSLGIKIYSIGVGKGGRQPVKIQDQFFGERIVHQNFPIDEKSLKEIANLTGGKYYRAHNPKELKDIYSKIDKLEKTKIESQVITHYSESFVFLIWIVLTLLLLEILLANTKLRKLP